ncbi:hypothetical protein GCK72_016806 [Caenorhabditis remanei]|uniref:Uncharacterized protein n=1 Tax=Caenorhabditis remanei TaxID=31234 RepID=A0A6A5G6Z9_CAERE|nr:hypothetical protein GCK72_016806 [Caenorhabditis remanei]KAF1750259.1 hypothetical protein GCK72_016806 [Caenorhabditis remanei]
MTIITSMQTKYPRSPFKLFLEASRSEDPSFSLKNLKDSIRNSPQQDGDEVTMVQIREHLRMEDWVDMKKEAVERSLYCYKSDGPFSFKTKLAFLSGCFIFGVICCQLVYNLYLGQELSFETRVVLIATTFAFPFFGTVLSLRRGGGNSDWFNDDEYNENYNSIKVSELKQRQLKLIDCYLNQVLPMEAEIEASRYRHDVLAMIVTGEWMFYTFFQFCYSIYHLSNNWSNKEIRDMDTMDAAISGHVFLTLSIWLIIFWHAWKIARRTVKHTKQADCGAVHF